MAVAAAVVSAGKAALVVALVTNETHVLGAVATQSRGNIQSSNMKIPT